MMMNIVRSKTTLNTMEVKNLTLRHGFLLSNVKLSYLTSRLQDT